jgi:hypothetical protein
MVRQHNDQRKKTTIFKALWRKLKIEQHEPHSKPVVNACAPDEKAVPCPCMAPIVLFLLQTKGVYINMCDECQKKKNIYVIIKLQMYVLLYKHKHITKKVKIVLKVIVMLIN